MPVVRGPQPTPGLLGSVAFALALALSPAACGGGGGGVDDQPAVSEIYQGAITTLEIEVDYQTGAAPYTGSVGSVQDIWQLLRDNTARLMQSAGVTVVVPSQLSEMEELGGIVGPSFTVDEILAIADAHRDQMSGAKRVTYYVVFLDGYFEEDGVQQEGVVGVSIGDTGVIAMFKPVIESTASVAFPNLPKYVEQSSLVHELGHALGLVNRGVPMVGTHHDAANGAHCTNDKCVMYYLNEGVTDAAQFVRDYVMNGNTIIFGAECLADVDAFGD